MQCVCCCVSCEVCHAGCVCRAGHVGVSWMLCDACSVLQHMHNNNIIYRDLKPENIVMATNGSLHSPPPCFVLFTPAPLMLSASILLLQCSISPVSWLATVVYSDHAAVQVLTHIICRYLKLVDLGFAKKMDNHMTYTVRLRM